MYGYVLNSEFKKRENLASEWFKKKKNYVFLVKDNNSDLAGRRRSHDPYVF